MLKKKRSKNYYFRRFKYLNNDFILLHECLLIIANFISQTPYERIQQSDINNIEEYFNNYINIIYKIILIVRKHCVDSYTSLPSFRPDGASNLLEVDFTNNQFKVLHDIFVFLNSLIKINMRGKFKNLSSTCFKRYYMRYYVVITYLYDRKDVV